VLYFNLVYDILKGFIIVSIFSFEAAIVTERKTYYLDLPTLLKVLRNKSGTLSCKIKIHGQWGNGLISLKRGQIEQSIIEWPNRRLEGKEAFEYLSSVQEWQVNFTDGLPIANISPTARPSSGVRPPTPAPQSYSPAPSMRISPSAPVIPRPLTPLNPFILAHYSPQQRTILQIVYGLVDGQKTTDQIKALSNVDAEIVDVALATLEHLGTISD
jgi:hypothetical protein